MSKKLSLAFVLVSVVACSSSSSGGDGGPSDAASESSTPADGGGDAAAPSCDAAFQKLVFSNASGGVSATPFMSNAKGDNSGGQPFLTVSDGLGRSFDFELFDATLPKVGTVFDYGTQGMPGGPGTAWGSYLEGSTVLTPVSGKVTVICSSASRFLAVSFSNVVFKGDPDAGAASLTINGSMGATIP